MSDDPLKHTPPAELDRDNRVRPLSLATALEQARAENERLRTTARGWYDQNTDLIIQRDKVWKENRELRAEIERLTAELENRRNAALDYAAEATCYRDRCTEAAAFLDELADRIYSDRASGSTEAAECRAEARKLRGENE